MFFVIFSRSSTLSSSPMIDSCLKFFSFLFYVLLVATLSTPFFFFLGSLFSSRHYRSGVFRLRNQRLFRVFSVFSIKLDYYIILSVWLSIIFLCGFYFNRCLLLLISSPTFFTVFCSPLLVFPDLTIFFFIVIVIIILFLIILLCRQLV